MPDNLRYSEYSGATSLGTVATDEATLNGTLVHLQVVKLAYGALNGATLVAGGTPYPVSIESGTVTISGAPSVTVSFPGTVSPGSLGTIAVGNFPTSFQTSNFPGTVNPGSLGTVFVAAGSLTLTGAPAVTVTFPGTVNPGSLGTIAVANTVVISGTVSQVSTARTPGLTRGTVAGTVAAGAYSLAFAQTGTFGTVGGVVLAANEVVSFRAPARDTLGSVIYNPGAGTLMIAEVR